MGPYLTNESLACGALEAMNTLWEAPFWLSRYQSVMESDSFELGINSAGARAAS